MLRPGYAQSRVDMRWVWRGFSILWPKAAAQIEPEPERLPLPTETKTENDQPPPVPAPRRRQVPVRRGKGWMGRLN